MKNRLISNWVTTLLGVVILLACLWMLFKAKHSAQDLSGWMTVGLLFLRSKDSLIALPPKE